MMLQDFIHKMTEGPGARLMKWAASIIAVATVAVWYDLSQFRNLSTQEGMDAAQLARRIGEGKGFSTDFIRPFSMYLIRQHRQDNDPLVREAHPDLANPPLYPLLLAGVLKMMPFGHPDVTADKSFAVYKPDLWIAGFNQLLFLVAAALLFRLAKRLFDESVAWGATAVFIGAELFWRFTLSGLGTMLLVVLLLLLAGVLAALDTEAQKPARGALWGVLMALGAGALAGAVFLTRYAAGLVVLPVLLHLAILPAARKVWWMVAAVGGFLLLATPWVARNVMISGTPFGTAGYAVAEDTAVFTGTSLGRSLQPDFGEFRRGDVTTKLISNGREILQNEIPKLGGSWVSAFFLVGLLMPFRSQTLGRLRVFLVLTLAGFAVAQAVGRTHLSADAPEVNSENLLAAAAPLVFMFGTSLFFVLLEQLALPMQGRFWLKTAAGGLVCAPLLLKLVSPAPSALAFPPYYPPWLQAEAGLFRPGEWVMSDVPWAMAWYGHRQSVWTSLVYRSRPQDRLKNDFFAIHRQKPVRGLHFSVQALKAMDARPLWDWVNRESDRPWEELVTDWEGFILAGVLLEREVPKGFPLKQAPRGLLPEIFLVDSERNSAKTIK